MPDDDDQQQTTTDNTNGTGAEGDDSEEWEPERAKNTIQSLRQAERQLKREKAEAERKLKALEDREKTELEKLREENERLASERSEWERERRETRARATFMTAAQRANVSRPDALFRLGASALEYDDEGNPKNVEDVIKDLRKEYPEFFTTGSADAATGRGGSSDGSTMTDRIRQAVRGR